MADAIHYRVVPSNPAAHLFTVTLTVYNPAEVQRLSLPAWIPGSYMIRDFAKHIVTIAARRGGEKITLHKIDKQSWEAREGSGPLEVTYNVYAWDLSVRGAHLDTEHGYFNGTSLFLRVEGQDDRPCCVELCRPDGDTYADWRVATTLPRDGAAPLGFGDYRAADYDALIDYPVEMGRFTLIEFEAAGVPHAMAITGRHYCDCERVAADLKKICEYQIGLFGEFPAERYLFLTTVVGDGYGGLEHRDSTSLMCSRDDLPRAGVDKIEDGYLTFLGLCSHEYFHTWNVKRIKPAAFTPYDLSREVHTTLLWAFEGITSYYDDLTLARCGLIPQERYLELLGQTITRVLRSQGRAVQSVGESSFDAWTKFYKQDENAANAIVSYYVKGAVIALALDLTLRRGSEGKVSLDHVMRGLWQQYGKVGKGIGEAELEQFVGELSGVDLKAFFDAAVRGTSDLPLAELLAEIGVAYHERAAESESDKGGKAGNGNARRVWLGARVANGGEAKVIAVVNGGPAQLAGITAGDQIIAVDGLKVSGGDLDKKLAQFKAGDRITLHVFRRDELHERVVELIAPPADTCYLTLSEKAETREAWLA